MTKQRIGVLVLIVALLMGLQHYGLEREPETLSEAPMKRVAGLPASDVLPTYIASLFFGAFRAVAVDVLWIQLRKVEEEKRWYERREIIRLISYVQPRNPEVWAHLGWHSAYNVANGFTDKEESWKWVKFGLQWLRRGTTVLPENPYIKHQLAYTLWQKVTVTDGELDMDLLKRFEADTALQAELLPDGVKWEHPMSMFEVAIPWLEKAREELLSKDFELTQMGLYIYPDSMDGYIRFCMMSQGMYLWQLDRRDEAKAWFVRLDQHCKDMVARAPDSPDPAPGGRKYKNLVSPLFKDYVKFYAKYPEIVDLEFKARSRKREDELALLKVLQEIIFEYGPIDGGWFYVPHDPHKLLNRVKQHLAGGEDVQECNDIVDLAWTVIPGEGTLQANLAPEGLDVDYYGIMVNPPPVSEDATPLKVPPQPIKLKITISRPKGQVFPLKVTLHDAHRQPLRTDIVTTSLQIGASVKEYGRYLLKVEAAKPETPWVGDTRYGLGVETE